MAIHHPKEEVDQSVFDRLTTLRDEVKLQLHLASLDAKKEWDETIEPRVLELEQAAKSFTESSPAAAKVKDLVARVEEFLRGLGSEPPPSAH